MAVWYHHTWIRLLFGTSVYSMSSVSLASQIPGDWMQEPAEPVNKSDFVVAPELGSQTLLFDSISDKAEA